jgi:hypothetical protein
MSKFQASGLIILLWSRLRLWWARRKRPISGEHHE